MQGSFPATLVAQVSAKEVLNGERNVQESNSNYHYVCLLNFYVVLLRRRVWRRIDEERIYGTSSLCGHLS